MDATSRKLIRRARLRRSHDRHARAAAKGYKKRQGIEHEDQRPEADQYVYDSDRRFNSINAPQSTVPNLPSLSDSQSLTGTHKSYRHQRRTRVPDGCPSDSYEPPSRKHSDNGKLSRGGNASDTAAVCSRQPPAEQVVKPQRRHRGKRSTQSDSEILPDERTLILSRMLKKKAEELNLPDDKLQEIKEMSGRLKIVNWLLDSGTVPLCANTDSKESTNSTYTTSSGNLVVVRRSSNNWFDAPRFVTREFSPISLNSELKSDFEEELSSLT